MHAIACLPSHAGLSVRDEVVQYSFTFINIDAITSPAIAGPRAPWAAPSLTRNKQQDVIWECDYMSMLSYGHTDMEMIVDHHRLRAIDLRWEHNQVLASVLLGIFHSKCQARAIWG